MRDPWDDDLAILSAENVNFAIETAGLGSRFAAATIDLTIQGLILALLAIAYNTLISYLPPLNTWSKWTLGLAAGFSGLLVFIVIWGYYLGFEWLWDGQTPGKRWLNLRVMMSNGMPLTPWAALVRNLIRVADFLPVGYGVGALLAIVNPNNRRAGDLVAGTIVARERHDASHQVLSIAQAADAFLAQAGASPSTISNNSVPPIGSPLNVTTNVVSPSPNEAAQSTLGLVQATIVAEPNERDVDVEGLNLTRGLDDQDYELTRDFLSRRGTLPRVARERLAHSLARRLAQKIDRPLPAADETEAFLETIAMALHQRR